ncbi:site-2 protease family protein [Roseateles sp. P5_E7]
MDALNETERAERPLGDALFSANWYRVATLKPRLRGHVRIHRHVYRGEIWYVVEDRVSGKYHRFNPSSYRVIGLLDGERSLQQVWERLSAAMDEHTPSQDELVQLFGQLYAADLIQCDVTPDVAELFERGGKQRRSKLMQRFANPVSLRFPLVDPDAWLGRVIAKAGPLKGWVGIALWLAVVLPAVLLAPSHWRELTGNINERLLAVDNLVLLAILFPLLKAAHEIGHGLAAKRFGGEVHEMGVMLLVFFPVPYVDASSSSAFESRWPRMLVGAAGMLTELFIAAIAFFLWLALEPGFARSLAFNVIVLASMTTLMFNANPLLRYDGYYIFADAIESPNLGQRSTDYWGWLLRYHLFGQHQAEPPPSTPGERRWFLVYAPLALAYRLFVMFSIAVFIASRYFFIGVLIAAWGLFASVILPWARGLKRLAGDPALEPQSGRVRRVLWASGAAVVLLLFVVPMPHHSVATGVVWPSDNAVLRARGGGFFSKLLVRPGTVVLEGQPVAELVDPMLDARIGEQRGRLELAQAKHDAAFGIIGMAPARAALLAEEVKREQAALAVLEDEAAKLVVRSEVAGVLLLTRPDDLPGRFFKRGEVLGHVDTAGPARVRLVLPQWQSAAVRGFEVRLPQQPGQSYEAVLKRSVPAAARDLPSPALGTAAGGEIPLDPHDPKGLQALQTLFEHELQLGQDMPYRQIGARVLVRLEHESEPVAVRVWDGLRRLFLSHFQL